MLDSSIAYQTTVRSSHVMAVKADAYYNGALVFADLPVSEGDISFSKADGVRGTLNLTLADATGQLIARSTTDPLAPYGQELRIQRGILLPSGSIEWVECGWYRIQSHKAKEWWSRPEDDTSGPNDPNTDTWEFGGASITIQAVDRMGILADARFLAVSSPSDGATVLGEILRLTQDYIELEIPINVSNEDLNSAVPKSITYEEDRIEALQALARSIDCELYVTRDGLLRLAYEIDRETAEPVDRAVPPVTQWETTWTRDGIYNAVVAKGETEESNYPTYGLARDYDPDSATYWNGPFGQVPMYYSSPFLTTTTAAQKAAATRLENVQKNRERRLVIDMVTDATYEIGDVVTVTLPHYKPFRAEIVELSVPLTPADTMKATVETLDSNLISTVVDTVDVTTGDVGQAWNEVPAGLTWADIDVGTTWADLETQNVED